jgi:proline iminopeptidase
MRMSVGDCRLYVDAEGPGLVPEGPTMRERPTRIAPHGGPDLDHTSFKPRFGALADYYATCMPLYARHRAPDAADVGARSLEHANFALFRHRAEGERRSYDLRGDLAAVAVPVLVLAGEDDPVTPVAGARALAAALGPERCRLEVFADCGHGVWRDQPDAAFAAMRGFITGRMAG